MTDDLRDRITAVIAAEIGWGGRPPAEVADAVLRELDTWDTLMVLLDQHYPPAVFPTLADDPGRDPGPRIVSLIRRINEIR